MLYLQSPKPSARLWYFQWHSYEDTSVNCGYSHQPQTLSMCHCDMQRYYKGNYSTGLASHFNHLIMIFLFPNQGAYLTLNGLFHTFYWFLSLMVCSTDPLLQLSQHILVPGTGTCKSAKHTNPSRPNSLTSQSARYQIIYSRCCKTHWSLHEMALNQEKKH